MQRLFRTFLRMAPLALAVSFVGAPPAVGSAHLSRPAADPAPAPAGITEVALERETPGDVLLASAPVSGFATVGVTWTGPAEPARFEIQARSADDAGTWGAWTALEPEAGPRGTSGTAPLVIGDAAQVEVRATGPAAAGVRDLVLTVVDPGALAADALVEAPAPASGPFGRSVPAATAVNAGGPVTAGWPGSTGAPAVHSRASWGADESIMTWNPAQGDVKAAVIHHTAGTNDYSPEDVPAILRGIYTYHAITRDWGDIGYNFLVDKYGNIWEGRAGGIELETIGAHVSGYNTNTVGVSVLGDYGVTTVTNEAVDAIVRLLSWKLSLHGVDAGGTVTLNQRSLPTIFGHRDVAATACPGQTLWERQGEIRSRVSAGQAAYASIRGQGTGAFVLGPSSGEVYLVSGTTKHPVTMPSLLALTSLGRVSDASQVYVDYLTPGAVLRQFVRNPADGEIALVDASTRYPASSCAMLAAFGAPCNGVNLTDVQWTTLGSGGLLSDAVMASDSATVYVMRDGVRRPVTSWARLLELYGGTAPAILSLSPSTLAQYPVGPAA